ncbi:MAG: homocysteine S-methyltransferase family protein [Candidatus Sumerlaeota bacterium]|nr:homocysteine S-methyltransferase family protein [Candidatus Sumerlaeota bacterium]
MHPTLESLLKDRPIVTDGAWGTQLQARGLEIGACPDAWNLEHPERVEEVARAYVEAGSRVILSNTFGATRFALDRYALAGKTAEINRAGAQISRRAAGDKVRVFASIGPSGKMLVMGEVSAEALRDAFREQTQALAEGGADGIVVETMSDLDEAKIAVAAAKETGLPVVASMVYDAGAKKDRTMMGVTPEQAAEGLAEAGADAIGANCGQGIAGFIPICERLRAATDRPLWIKPNAGLPEVVEGKTVYRTTPEEFVARVPALLRAGAAFLGGCCGTSPDFIRALRASLKPAGA